MLDPKSQTIVEENLCPSCTVLPCNPEACAKALELGKAAPWTMEEIRELHGAEMLKLMNNPWFDRSTVVKHLAEQEALELKTFRLIARGITPFRLATVCDAIRAGKIFSV